MELQKAIRVFMCHEIGKMILPPREFLKYTVLVLNILGHLENWYFRTEILKC